MFSAAKTSGLTGYTLNRSLRFRSSASAYLNRTPASAGNRQKWTWSAWVKRGGLTTPQFIMFSATSGTGTCQIGFQGSGNDGIVLYDSSLGPMNVTTTSQYRDPSAWYHIVIAVDTTQSTAANRVLMYVNGVQITSFSTATYPSQNANTGINNNVTHGLGTQYSNGSNAGNYFDGYLAEVNFIDGQALTPSSFGAYNATTGVWQPTKYSGTYGTNGFYLNFNNNASTTTLGYDTSGNSNNWTTNNISLTAGVTYDSMLDVPTLTSATAANYATWNWLYNPNSTNSYLSQANLNFQDSSNSGSWRTTISTIAIPYGSGKFYWEATVGAIGSSTGNEIGIVLLSLTGASISPPSNSQAWFLYWNSSQYQTQGGGTTTNYSGATAGDVVMVAYDAINGQIWFGKNGTWFVGNPSAGTGASYTGITSDTVPHGSVFSNNAGGGGNAGFTTNFGQRPFIYTPPTGFVALNTYNLPTPTIVNGAAHMAATKYTGTGTTQSINNGTNTTIGTTFQPDLVWMKSRSVTDYNLLVDSVRGVGKWLSSNATLAEVAADTNVLTSFNSNGFTVGADPQGSDAGWNPSGASQIAWQWKAGNGSSSNTNGSITSTVSVNAAAGFSVVTYTGTGANATVGHGLGVAPSLVITKYRGGAASWNVYHASLGATQYLYLDQTAAAATNIVLWNNTAPTSSVFSIGTGTGVNPSGGACVAYCWSQVAGFSKFGSYVGNGSADGPFVFTNFQPRWLMIKRTDSTSDWYIFDTTRDTYNVEAATLLADSSGVETSAASIDGLSNGFKCRSSTVVNVSGATYIYAAFASNPFRNSLAR